MARKGENIYKRRDGRWEGRFMPIGMTRYKSIYAGTYTEVKSRLRQAISAQNGARKPAGKMLFEEVVVNWLKASRIRVKDSTFSHYMYVVNKRILPKWGKHTAVSITAQATADYVQDLLEHGGKNGKRLAAKTERDTIVILRDILKYGSEDGFMVRCNFKDILPKTEKTDIRILSPLEQKKLTEYLVKDVDLSKLGVLLCLYTGIRIGELCALKWEDIDLCESVVKIHSTLLRIKDLSPQAQKKTKIIIDRPKSDCSIRTIPLPRFLVPFLMNISGQSKAFLLTGTDDFIEPRTMQNRFKSYLKNAKVADTNFHALRHTFATRFVEVGCDVKTLSEILGHSNIKITLERYFHSSMDLKRANMEKLTACLGNRRQDHGQILVKSSYVRAKSNFFRKGRMLYERVLGEAVSVQ